MSKVNVKNNNKQPKLWKNIYSFSKVAMKREIFPRKVLKFRSNLKERE